MKHNATFIGIGIVTFLLFFCASAGVTFAQQSSVTVNIKVIRGYEAEEPEIDDRLEEIARILRDVFKWNSFELLHDLRDRVYMDEKTRFFLPKSFALDVVLRNIEKLEDDDKIIVKLELDVLKRKKTRDDDEEKYKKIGSTTVEFLEKKYILLRIGKVDNGDLILALTGW